MIIFNILLVSLSILHTVKAQPSVSTSAVIEIQSSNVAPLSVTIVPSSVTIVQTVSGSEMTMLVSSLLPSASQFTMITSTSTIQLQSTTTVVKVTTSPSALSQPSTAISSTHHSISNSVTTSSKPFNIKPIVVTTTSTIPAPISSSKPTTTVSSTSEPQTTNGVANNGGSTDDTAAESFLTDLKYIYIIAGIILFLILVIVLLMAVVIVMCQRKQFEKQQMKKKRAKEMMMMRGTPPQPPAAPSATVAPSSVVVERQQRNSTPSTSSAVQSPKRVAKPPPPEVAPKNGSLKRKPDSSENGGISDFPLLCRVLQDYDSTHHKARQDSVSSNDNHAAPSPQPHLPTPRMNGGLQHTISLPHETPEQTADAVFVPMPMKPVQLVRPVAAIPQKASLLANETISPTSSLPAQPSKAGYRDSNDYDELEGIADQRKRIMKSMSPPFTTSRTPIGARIPAMLPLTYKPMTFHRPPKTNKVNRNESIRRSQSTNDIFDDPKYTRLSVGSPTITTQPTIQEDIYDRLDSCNLPPAVPPKHGKESQNPVTKAPLTMKRSFSTLNPNDISVDGKKKHKDYMSLKQILDIMETKIPSREASVETDYQDERPSFSHPNLHTVIHL